MTPLEPEAAPHEAVVLPAGRRWGVVLGLAGLRLALATVVATPLVSVFASSGIGHYPAGDALLFEPGGLMLVEVVRRTAPALGASFNGSLGLLLLAVLPALFGVAVLMVALVEPGRLKLPSCLARAAEVFPSFVLISGLSALAQAAVVLCLTLLGGSLGGSFGAVERSADLVLLVSLLAGLLGAGLVQMLADLARAARVAGRSSTWDALAAGLNAARGAPGRAAGSFALAAVAALAAVVGSAIVTQWLAVDRAGSWRVALVFVVHQLTVLFTVYVHAVWYSAALRLVSPRPAVRLSSRPAAADTLEHNDALDDPTRDRGA